MSDSSTSKVIPPLEELKLPANYKDTCIPFHVFTHFDLELQRRYAMRYSQEAGLLDGLGILNLLFTNNTWLPPLDSHIAAGLGLSGDRPAVDNDHMPSPVDEYSGLDAGHLGEGGPEDGLSPQEFSFPPKGDLLEMGDRAGIPKDWMMGYMDKLRLQRKSLFDKVDKACLMAREAAVEVAMFAAAYQKEKKLADESLEELQKIVGPKYWALVEKDFQMSVNAGGVPLATGYGDHDYSLENRDDSDSEDEEGDDSDDNETWVNSRKKRCNVGNGMSGPRRSHPLGDRSSNGSDESDDQSISKAPPTPLTTYPSEETTLRGHGITTPPPETVISTVSLRRAPPNHKRRREDDGENEEIPSRRLDREVSEEEFDEVAWTVLVPDGAQDLAGDMPPPAKKFRQAVDKGKGKEVVTIDPRSDSPVMFQFMKFPEEGVDTDSDFYSSGDEDDRTSDFSSNSDSDQSGDYQMFDMEVDEDDLEDFKKYGPEDLKTSLRRLAPEPMNPFHRPRAKGLRRTRTRMRINDEGEPELFDYTRSQNFEQRIKDERENILDRMARGYRVQSNMKEDIDLILTKIARPQPLRIDRFGWEDFDY